VENKERWGHPGTGDLVQCLLGRSDGTLGTDQWYEIGTVMSEPTYWNDMGSASVDVMLSNGDVTQIHCGRLEIVN
jgi:hypothetical protein